MPRRNDTHPDDASNPMREQCKRLEVLSRARERPEMRREVEEALRSKWEGVRASAAKVLGTWGGRRSVEALRKALEDCRDKHAGWALRGVLVRALCKCADPDDAPWMIDFYFDAAFHSMKRASQWEFWPFVRAAPKPLLRKRIELELRSPSTSRKEAAERARAWLERSG